MLCSIDKILKYFCVCQSLSGECSFIEHLCESCNAANLSSRTFYSLHFLFDIYESMHRDTFMKVTNKMQLYRLIYYS
jgi:hypothetical protein